MLDAGELAPPITTSSGLLHFALAVYLDFRVSAHFSFHVLENAPGLVYVELYRAFHNTVSSLPALAAHQHCLHVA